MLVAAISFAFIWLFQAGANARLGALAHKKTGRNVAYISIQKYGSYRLGPNATWEAARRQCQREAAHLWIINSAGEEEEVIKQLRIEWSVWIAADDFTTKGEFVTPHGTTLNESGYENWEYGVSFVGYRAVAVNKRGFLELGVISDTKPYVCEKHSPEEPSEARHPWLPTGYRRIHSGASGRPSGFYKAHADGAPWEAARRRCEAEGARLWGPRSPAEAAAVAQALDPKRWYWVGFHNWDHVDKFVTLDGQQLNKELTCEMCKNPTSKARCGMTNGKGEFIISSGYEESPYVCELYNPGERPMKPTRQRSPPKGYSLIGSSYYKLSQEEMMWESARRRCQADGAHLAFMNSQEEVEGVIVGANITDDLIFIGFDDFQLSLEYVYLDGTRVAHTSVKWDPSSYSDPKSHAVGCISAKGIKACSPMASFSFLCEWESPSTTGTQLTYPHNYLLKGNLGFYKVYSSTLPWMAAKRICEAEGAHLLVLNSEEEAKALIENIRIRDWMWIGFEDLEREGDFRTILYKQTLSIAGYDTWYRPSNNRLDNTNKGKRGRCGMMSVNGMLGTGECHTAYPFICELKRS